MFIVLSQSLPRLKILDLSDSPNLIKTPDFTEAPNLEKLILSGCFKLKKFPEIVENMKCLKKLKLDCLEIKELSLSIGRLCGLTILDLGNCHRLLTLPSVICNLTSLQNLTLCGCSELDKMPEDLGNLKRLTVLDVRRTAIRQVPSSIQKLKNLKDLCFGGCKGLLVYPTSFLGLCHLTTLDLSYCDLPDGAIPNDLSSMSSLQILDLRGNNIEHIPESISQLSKLKIILLRDCSRLRSLPILPPNVLYVQADDTTSLKTLCREMFGWYTEGQHLSVSLSLSLSLSLSHTRLLLTFFVWTIFDRNSFVIFPD
jgi:Leucine-rich repeat (LRR) protein